MEENRSTIIHTVNGPGYKYDIIKGELAKGSYISKSVHPLSEVECFKQKLMTRKLLKDAETHWVLKKNVKTGHLMAVNLHFGFFLAESPYKQDIVVTAEEASRLESTLPEKHVCVTDSDIVMKSICDTLRFSSTNIIEVNNDVFIHHGSDTFGQDEAFVLKFFQARGIISSSARHGSSGKGEADIVDEATGDQYEITYEFKTELPKRLMKPDLVYSPEILALQLVDSPFIHTSKSLCKKFKKKYSSHYRPNLVILTIGSKESTISMLSVLGEELQKEQLLELGYANIYILALDFLNENALFVKISATEPFYSDVFPCKNDELGFIKLTSVNFSDMEDNRKYLMVCNGIFDKTQRIRYDEGKTLKLWAKNIRIWGC